MSIRPIKRIVQSKPTIEGAGVKLRRAFGFGDTQETDPFLLLDDFLNDRPQDYLAGFPWHPHRGIARRRAIGDVERSSAIVGSKRCNGTDASANNWRILH